MELKDFFPDNWEWLEEHINKHYRSSYFFISSGLLR